MPRTKRVRNSSKPADETTIPNDVISELNKRINKEEKRLLKRVHMEQEAMLLNLERMHAEEKVKLTPYLNKSLHTLYTTGFTFSTLSTISIKSNSVQSSIRKQQRSQSSQRNTRRSKSKDDEGYLTSGSRSSSLTRNSRSQKQTTVKKNPRRSRSCSNANSNAFVTPMGKAPPLYGIITPKVKPNTPQAIVRRPDIGEMAFSVHGSPLLAVDVQSRHPNINLPLGNGKVVSILPFSRLRDSEVPDIDKVMREQVKILHENLGKVLEAAKRQ